MTLKEGTGRYAVHNDAIAAKHGETAADVAGKHLRECRIRLSRVPRLKAAPGVAELRGAVEALLLAVEAVQ